MRELGHLEGDVMAILWDNDEPMTTKDVLSVLRVRRPLAYTTVMTVMDNLHGKGLVGRTKRGRAYLYAPVSTREEYTASVMEQVLATSANPAATLLHFVEQIPADEVKRLREVLQQASERGSTQ